MNWVGIIFSFGLIALVVLALVGCAIFESVTEKRRARERDRRWHRPVKEWWEMEIK